MEEVGFVKSIQKFLVKIEGLPKVKLNDLIEVKNEIIGYVFNIWPDHVDVMMLSEVPLEVGEMVRRSKRRLKIKVGDFLIGRVVDPLIRPLDNKPLFLEREEKIEEKEIEKTAPGIEAREIIKEQLETGIPVIDTILPLGKGQRELIIGDARSGKTSFLIKLIENLKESGIVCVYVLLGKSIDEVRNLMNVLEERNCLNHTVVVAVPSSELSPLIFLAPFSGMTVAEYFQSKGKDVLIILDDIRLHAQIYREMALFGERAPGREFYPGDIVFQHAHLLERAGNFSKDVGGGSITALPVIEIDLDEFATFIPTNLISMTDGHLLFDSSLYAKGQFPPIVINRSVTRVGRQTQHSLQASLVFKLQEVLARSSRFEALSRFGEELPPETKLLLKRREMILELLNYNLPYFLNRKEQLFLLYLPFSKFLEKKDVKFLKKNKEKIVKAIKEEPEFSKFVKNIFSLKEREILSEINNLSRKLEKICQL